MFLQLDDLVAQQCGVFEIEELGGLLHLGGQVVDGFLALSGSQFVRGLLVGLLGAADFENIAHTLFDSLRRDAVFLVEFVLNAAAAIGLVDGGFHRAGDTIGVHDDLALGVSGGASDDLN
ncbi:hypothetical protein SDC9_180013 [bioreactor metagenome]|uniref:NAD-specific glutamate dehydrogenase n=1 Tax=bioreactor metagenome TaxID=1076179 RepID=A0A645H8D7_9ZZZZ